MLYMPERVVFIRRGRQQDPDGADDARSSAIIYGPEAPPFSRVVRRGAPPAYADPVRAHGPKLTGFDAVKPRRMYDLQ